MSNMTEIIQNDDLLKYLLKEMRFYSFLAIHKNEHTLEDITIESFKIMNAAFSIIEGKDVYEELRKEKNITEKMNDYKKQGLIDDENEKNLQRLMFDDPEGVRRKIFNEIESLNDFLETIERDVDKFSIEIIDSIMLLEFCVTALYSLKERFVNVLLTKYKYIPDLPLFVELSLDISEVYKQCELEIPARSFDRFIEFFFVDNENKKRQQEIVVEFWKEHIK